MLIHTYLSCFHILAIVKNHVLTIVMNVAVNSDVQILSLRDPAFSSSDYMPRSGIAGSYGKSGFPSGASGQEPTCQHQRRKRFGFDPWVGKIPGGGHGNLLQNFCLENPVDWGAWWANAWQICLILEEPPYCFQEQLHHFTSQPALHKGSYFPTYSQHLLFSGVLIVAISMGVRWYLVMVWFAFCWWTVMLSIFSWVYRSFINLLWRNVYLRPLLTF